LAADDELITGGEVALRIEAAEVLEGIGDLIAGGDKCGNVDKRRINEDLGSNITTAELGRIAGAWKVT
jgi:hypothetical protein